MIYDTLNHIKNYIGLHPRLDQALSFLMRPDLSSLSDGKYVIDADAVFATISPTQNRPENPTPEAHRTYIDVQFLIEGEELIRVAPIEEMEEEVSANPEGDIWFYRGGGQNLRLDGNRFLILFPNDAHAPCIDPAGGSSVTRKVVIKVQAW